MTALDNYINDEAALGTKLHLLRGIERALQNAIDVCQQTNCQNHDGRIDGHIENCIAGLDDLLADLRPFISEIDDDYCNIGIAAKCFADRAPVGSRPIAYLGGTHL